MPAADGSISAGEAVAKAESGEAVMSFVDGDSPADSADAILAEVLGEGGDGTPAAEAPAEGAPAKEGEAPAAEAAPEEEAAPAAPETPEAAKLRKAWAKLHGEKQGLLEEKQAAKRAVAEAESYRQGHTNFQYIVKKLQEDPAGLLEELETSLGIAGLSEKTLQGFAERTKSPAEFEVQKMRRELAERDAREERAKQERVAAEWRDGIVRQVQGAGEEYDLVNTLGLHQQVIDTMTGYWERHNAVLDWKTAAKLVEDHHAERIAASKRYGKRAPTPQVSTPATATKDASSAKAPAPAKRAPTLSAVPVAEAPSKGSELSLDPDLRERQLMAEMGFS